MKKTIKPKSVEAYISSSPKEFQKKLKEIQKIIKKSAPKAFERISYGMPYYDYKGRLAYFLLAKNHIGLYIPPPIIEQFKFELINYSVSKGTVRFPHDKKLPIYLIKKLVKARVKYNDSKFKS